MTKRETPPEEIERLRERLHNYHGDIIKNEVSFNIAFSNEINLSAKEMTPKQKKLMNDVYKSYKREFKKDIQKELKDFKKAVPLKERKQFLIPARSKGRIVYTEKIFVVVQKKKVVRFRDRRGRFASVGRAKPYFYTPPVTKAVEEREKKILRKQLRKTK